MRYVRLHLTLLILMLLVGAALGEIEMEPQKPCAFYLTPNEKAELVFNMKNVPAGKKLTYTLSNYWGEVQQQNTAVVSTENTLTIPVQCTTGYYELSFPDAKRIFGIVVRPESPPNPDGVFGMDCGMSWGSCPGLNDEARAAMPEILRKSGISMARERIAWWGVCHGAGNFTWGDVNGALRYEVVREFYRKASLPILECFTEAPDWLGASNFQKPINPFPKDLIGSADCWKGMAEKFGDVWGAVEVSNEPDNHPIPADHYVPMAKAMAWGLREAGWKGALVGLSCAERSQAYKDTAAQNGLFDVCDAVSFHTYNPPMTIQAAATMYRELFQANGCLSKPIWLSESGWPWGCGPAQPDAQSDNNSARNIAMKGVECQANGIARFFAFYLQFHEESIGNFGMTGRSFTPLRSMAGYMQAARVIGPKQYLGDLKIKHPGIELARVFGLEKEIVAVLYTRDVSPDQTIPFQAPITRIEGIDGRVLTLTKDGAIPVPDGMVYVYLDPATANRYIKKDTPAARLLRISRRPAKPGQPVPVALHSMIPLDSAKRSTQAGYHLTDSQAEKFEITVAASNFTTEPKKITVKVICDPKVKFLSGETTRTLTLQPRSREELKWVCDLSAAISEDEFKPLIFRVVAEEENGTRLDRASMWFYRMKRPIQMEIPRARRGINIDGVLAAGEWDHVPAITNMKVCDPLDPAGQPKAEDLSGAGKFQWAADGLYFAILVRDQTHLQDQTPQLTWRQDGIQIACASVYDPKQPFKQAQYEFGCHLGDNGAEFIRFRSQETTVKASKVAIVRDDKAGTTVYEGRIAWSEIPPVKPGLGSQLYLTFLVNDDDGSGRKWMEWTPGIAGIKNVDDFAEVKMVK